MATIRQRNKKWQVQVRRLHYGSLSQTFTHKKDALQWARENEIELQQHSLKFKGGKGVATYVGILFCINILFGLLFISTWLLLYFIFKSLLILHPV